MSRFSPPTTPAGSGAYARPPPPPGGFHPPPPGGFHPPPPGQGQQQPLNQGMSNLSIGSQQQIRPAMFNPPAPQGPPGPQVGFAPPTPVGSFPSQPPPPPGGVPLPPMAPRLPTMFMPPALSSSGAPPPTLTQPPPLNQPASVTQHGQLNPTTSNSSFFMPAPTPGQMQRVTAPPAPSGITPGMPNQMESVDLSITIPPSMFRFTCGAIPGTPSLLSQAKVPVGGLVRPLAPIADDDEPVETVQPGNAGIIRCKKCRTYINGFVTWMENGRRWRCNICAQVNDCPSTYFCHLDEKGQRRDKDERPELSKGVVEFLAPAEYMVRPPQEPTYFFVIDVSAMSVRSGMLTSAANAIRRSLDDLPGGGRTKIGFITYDSSVHYYNLSSDLKGPQMMVVSDLNELFVPLPDNLLVNAKESRHVIEAFLDSLPDMFSKNPVVSASCLGPALKAAFTVTKQIGGKMCVFQSIMPNLGDGALRPRENQTIMGTPNEIKVLRPDIPWYKDTAIEFSRQQISVDMFLFPYQYMDVSALSELPKYTSGALFSYVGFHPEKDGPRFESELHKRLTQTTAFEAVMRIRCTKGMRITNFYGNFFIRGTDLLALPNCTSDSVFAFDLVHDEQNMPSSVVTIQAALLYTSSDGQRRIRVMTQAFPLTNSMPEFIASVDAEATCCLMSKQALDLSMKTTIDNARMRLQQTCVEVIRASKGGRSVSGYSVPPPGAPGGGVADSVDADIPENLELLPVYTLAMMKNVAFRGGTDVHPDERICAQFALNSMWVDQCRDYIYPRMFSIHDMSRAVGLPFEGNLDDDDVQVAGRKNILLPQVVNLTCERLRPDGIFLLDNGMQMNLWIGHSANSNTLNSLLGISSLDNVDVHQLTVNLNGDDFANRFGSVVFALREMEGEQFLISPKIEIVREGDIHLEARFFWSLIEDRASFQGGTYNYAEFMDFIKNPQSVGGPQASSLNPVRTGAPPARGPPPPGPPGQPQNYGSASSFQQGQPPPGNYGPPPPGQPNVPHNQHGPIINRPPSQGNQTSGFMPPPHSAPPGVPSYGQPPPPANVGIPPTSSSSFKGPPPPPVGNRGGPPALHGGYNVPPPFGNQGVPPQTKPGEPPSQASYGAPPQGQLGMPPTAPSGNTPPSRLSENNQVTSQGPPGNIRMPPPPGPPGSFQSSLPGSVGNRGGPQIQGGRLPPPPGGGTPGVPPPPGRAQGGLPPPPKMGAPRPPPPPPQYS